MTEEPPVTRKGKIGRLPASVREALNLRLRDGEQAPIILPWLARQKEVRRILERDFGGAEISAQNLSEWRMGGYAEWLKSQTRVEAVRNLSELSFRLAKASGGSMAEGAIAIAGGRILEVLEDVAALPLNGGPDEESSPNLKDIIESLVSLRMAELGGKKIQIETIKLGQKDKLIALEQQRFERTTAELFLTFYAVKRAGEIAEGKASKDVKIDLLRELMFGKRPGEDTA